MNDESLSQITRERNIFQQKKKKNANTSLNDTKENNGDYIKS